ncbi:M48 family peptidase [bacterium]|nr:MAG: M48 family peptidase [bacterium]
MAVTNVDKEWLASRREVPGIRSADYEYAADRAALKAFKSVPGADWLVQKWLEFWLEFDRASLLGSAVKVSERQFPEVHAHLERCAAVLSISAPPLFVVERPYLNAFALGTDDGKAFLVVTRKLLEVVNDRELVFILGHELGHIKSKHVLYATLAVYLANIGLFAGSRIPGLALLAYPLRFALLAWYRRSEVTCDRAGLVCAQDLEAGRKALLVTGCGSREFADRIDLAEFAKQADEMRQSYGKWGEAFISHPYLPKRVKALELFAESHFYKRRVQGESSGRFLDMGDLDAAVREVLGDGDPAVESTVEGSDPARLKAGMALAGAWLGGKMTSARRQALDRHLEAFKAPADMRAFLKKPFPAGEALKSARYFTGDAAQGLPYAFSLYFVDVERVRREDARFLADLAEACGYAEGDAERLLRDVAFRKETFRARCTLDYCAPCGELYAAGERACPHCGALCDVTAQPDEKKVKTVGEKLGDLGSNAAAAAMSAGQALMGLAERAARAVASARSPRAEEPPKEKPQARRKAAPSRPARKRKH